LASFSLMNAYKSFLFFIPDDTLPPVEGAGPVL